MEGKEEKKSTQEVHLPSDQSSKIMSASVSSKDMERNHGCKLGFMMIVLTYN